FQAVLARQPNHEGSLHHLGVIALQTGRHDLAIELIGRAIALNDQVPEFHYNIGIAYGWLGKFDQAIAHNRKAIELKPDHFAAYRQAIRFNPRLAMAEVNLGAMLAADRQHAEARACFQRALAARPELAAAHKGLGKTLQAMGDLGRALEAFRQAESLDDTVE